MQLTLLIGATFADGSKDMISEEALLADSLNEYMNAAQLAFFEQRLHELKRQTGEHIEEARSLLASPPELNDDGDRERKLLPKIDQALRRIKRGEYG